MTKFTFVFLMGIIAICLIYCVVMCAVLVHHYCKLNAEYKKVKNELRDIQNYTELKKLDATYKKEPKTITEEDLKKMADEGKFDRVRWELSRNVLNSQKAIDKDFNNAISSIKTKEEKDVIGNVWFPKNKEGTNDKN